MGAYSFLNFNKARVSYEVLQQKYCKAKDKVYQPNAKNAPVYERLYAMYKDLQDSFGTEGTGHNMFHIMKDLIRIKTKANNN